MNDTIRDGDRGHAPEDADSQAARRPEVLPPADDAPESGGRERELQDERDRFYDLLLRKTAEFDNYRKRSERERRDLYDTAASDLLLEFVGIVDDLERALATPAGTETAEAYRAGVELIHRQMLELLKRRGVRAIDALGTDFDPRFHQSVTSEESPGHRDGEVLAVFRRGYLLGERLLRPAMVKVARA
jgi:molecular chaperone GrpE